MRNFFNSFTIFLILFSASFLLFSCGGWDPQSARDTPVRGVDRAKKNVEEGRGISLKNLGRSGTTNYEFSTSNPMWRATFDVIDFMPLTTVDYSGGTIITDWYTDSKSSNESLKFTIRFLSSEVRADSVKIIIHKKTCIQSNNCTIRKISSRLEDEIRTAILQRAARLKKGGDKKKIKKKENKEKNKKKGFLGFGKGKSAKE